MTHDPVWRRSLLDLRAHTSERVRKLEQNLELLTTARRGSSDDDEHDPEGATLSGEWSMLTGLIESARDDAAEIDTALERLANGTYGVCRACGKPISEGQLEARPARERCVACTD